MATRREQQAVWGAIKEFADTARPEMEDVRRVVGESTNSHAVEEIDFIKALALKMAYKVWHALGIDPEEFASRDQPQESEDDDGPPDEDPDPPAEPVEVVREAYDRIISGPWIGFTNLEKVPSKDPIGEALRKGLGIHRIGIKDWCPPCRIDRQSDHPVTLESIGPERAVIKAYDHATDTFAVFGGSNVTLRGLDIQQPPHRAGILFAQQNAQFGGYAGWTLEDIGLADSGHPGKWFIQAYHLKNCVFDGKGRKVSGAVLEGVVDEFGRPLKGIPTLRQLISEHFFYDHNQKSDVTVKNYDIEYMGRTAFQARSPSKFGVDERYAGQSPGQGSILLQNINARNCGISQSDNGRGGYGFTFAGRHEGEIVVDGCSYRHEWYGAPGPLDRDPLMPIVKTWSKQQRPGNGALVVWGGKENAYTEKVTIRDSNFFFAPGLGSSPVVALDAIQDLSLDGVHIDALGNREALHVSRPRQGTRLYLPVKRLSKAQVSWSGVRPRRSGQPWTPTPFSS